MIFFFYFPENYSRRVCKSTNKKILAKPSQNFFDDLQNLNLDASSKSLQLLFWLIQAFNDIRPPDKSA